MFADVTSRARGGAASTTLVLIAVACGGAEDKPYNEAAPFNSFSSAGAAGTGTSGGSGGNLGGTDGNGGSGLIAAGGTGGDAVNTGGTAGITAGSGNVAGTAASAGASGSATGGDAGSVGLGGGGGDLAQGGEAGSANGGESGAPPVVDCSSHGETAHGFDSHCYVFVADRVTWKEAHDACESRGAYLVTISSEDRSTAQFLAENSFVWGLSQQVEVWIAATDGRGPHQKGNGTYFAWDNGEPMTLDNWSSGQPNNSQTSCDADPCSCDDGACYEHCGFLWTTPGKQMDAVPGWNDRLCDHRLGFVCEWGD